MSLNKYLIALAIVAVIVFPFVMAEENTTVNMTADGSYVIVQYEDSNYNLSRFPVSTTYRIAQGETVYLNDTIDISGMGWGTGVAWYGKWDDSIEPRYVREFKDYPHDAMNFYIDPVIFSDKLGVWYQYYGNKSEKQGNLKAFVVAGKFRETTLTYQNGTVINQSVLIKNESKTLELPKPTILPEVHEADYLLAIGDPLIVKTYGPAQVWIFGRTDKLYGSTETDNMTFEGKDFYSFESGTYTLLIQHPGNNTQYEVRYSNGSLQQRDGWNGIKSVDVSAKQPGMILEKLEVMLMNTDDDYIVYTLEIDQPSITIKRIDEMWIGSKVDEYKLQGYDVAFKDVRGYTNLMNGTNISVVLDQDYFDGRKMGRFTVYADTYKSALGNRTMFQAYVPIIYDTIPRGMHTITAKGPYNSYVDANFAITDLPPDSFRPNTSLKYTVDENPWKPNLTIPTPVIVTVKETVIQIKEVPPSNETVYEQQKKAVDTKWGELISTGTFWILAVIGAFVVVRFIYRAWKRRQWVQK